MNRVPIVYSDNRILLSQEAAHTMHEIPLQSWGFLSAKQKQNYWHGATGFFSQSFPNNKNTGGHLLVTNSVYSADEWHANIIKAANENLHKLDSLHGYVDASKQCLDNDVFFDRSVYLFTQMGDRQDSQGGLGWLNQAIRDLYVGVALDDAPPEVAEIQHWVDKAKTIDETIQSSWMQAKHVGQHEIEWLYRHLDTPGLPTPALSFDVLPDGYPAWATPQVREEHARELESKGLKPEQHAIEQWGLGQWHTVLGSYVGVVDIGKSINKDALRGVQFDSPTGTAYACYLPINHIPGVIGYNVNWLHHSANLPFPVDASLHFQVLDPTATEKALERPIKAAENQAMEDQEAGASSDEANQESRAVLSQVQKETRRSKTPIVYWQCVLSVYDTTKDGLRQKVNELVSHYKQGLQFELVCPVDDQRELFYQSLPGSSRLLNDWIQITPPAYLAAAAPWLSANIGDSKGLYQGYTLTTDNQGKVSKGSPFFYDIFNVVDDEIKAPTEVVAGFPGSGKALALNTLVPRADQGFTTLGELCVGDQILDETGAPCTVTFVTPTMYDHEAFEMAFDDGTTVLADSDHRWYTEDRAARMSMRSARKNRRRKNRGSSEFVVAMEQAAQFTDPEDLTFVTDMWRRYKGIGPYRDVWLRIAKTVEPAGMRSVAQLKGGGGRVYPVYRVADLAQAALGWASEIANDQTSRRAMPQVRTTRQIAETLYADGGRPNHSIPLAAPVQYPTRDFAVDPYVLGAWLGDGASSGAGSWSSEDPELMDELRRAGLTVGEGKAVGNHRVYAVHGLRRLLKPLEVLRDKHIPEEYLAGDADQRLALLQGLMDTDGSVTPHGTCEFYQSDERVAKQVRSLVASLGMKATLRSREGAYKDPHGDKVVCKTAYTVAFKPNAKVFRLSRKLARLDLSANRATTERRYIVDVRPVESVPVRCITVDSPNHLYLCTDQYIPTHNTVSRGLKCVLEDGLKGVTQFVWDPKGDFRSLSQFAREMGLDPHKVNLIDLGDPKASISLDAFAVAEVSVDADKAEDSIDERGTLATRILTQLLKSYMSEGSGAAGWTSREVINNAVERVLRGERFDGGAPPSMLELMRTLERWSFKQWDEIDQINNGVDLPLIPNENSVSEFTRSCQAMLSELRAVQKTKLGRLLFKQAQNGVRGMKIIPGSMTIFIAMNMRMREEGESEDRETLISDIIGSLMTDYIRSLLSDKALDNKYKSATFDEWHAIKRNGGADGLLSWLRRIGRTGRCCVRQLSQSAGDFDNNSLTTAWCGRVENEDEAKLSCHLLGIEKSPNNIQRLLNLQTGEFLFRDSQGRVAWVKVDIWSEQLMDWIDTQAKHREERALREQNTARRGSDRSGAA